MRIREMIIALERLLAKHGDMECRVAVGRDVADADVVERIYDNMVGAYTVVISDEA